MTLELPVVHQSRSSLRLAHHRRHLGLCTRKEIIISHSPSEFNGSSILKKSEEISRQLLYLILFEASRPIVLP